MEYFFQQHLRRGVEGNRKYTKNGDHFSAVRSLIFNDSTIPFLMYAEVVTDDKNSPTSIKCSFIGV